MLLHYSYIFQLVLHLFGNENCGNHVKIVVSSDPISAMGHCQIGSGHVMEPLNIIRMLLVYKMTKHQGDSEKYTLTVDLNPFDESYVTLCSTPCSFTPYTDVEHYNRTWLLNTVVAFIVFFGAPSIAKRDVVYYIICSFITLASIALSLVILATGILYLSKVHKIGLLSILIGCLVLLSPAVSSYNMGHNIPIYSIIVTLLATLLTFNISYINGPPSPRCKNLIKWNLRILAIASIVIGSGYCWFEVLLLLFCFYIAWFFISKQMPIFSRFGCAVISFRLRKGTPMYPNKFIWPKLTESQYQEERKSYTLAQLHILFDSINNNPGPPWPLLYQLRAPNAFEELIEANKPIFGAYGNIEIMPSSGSESED